MKIILTGATGMVGEGVLLECLENPEVEKVLMVNRKPSPLKHSKLKELIIPDFMKLDGHDQELSGYDGCFYCAGVSSIGMSEEKYSLITHDTTLHFARKVAALNENMVFTFVTGSGTDSSEKGNIMWARVKGRTENHLLELPFRAVYNFRPGVMSPFKGQQNVHTIYKPFIYLFSLFLPKKILSLKEVGQAMINAVIVGFPKNNLEISDIRALSKR